MVDSDPSVEQVTRLASVEQMAETLEFSEVQFYNLSIDYRDQGRSEAVGAEPQEVGVDVTTSIRTRGRGIDYRVRFSLPYPNGDVLVDAGAIFDSQSEVTFDDEVALEFGDGIALMVLFPYVRQAVNDLGLRVGVPIVMPLLKRGDLSFRQSPAATDGETAS